MNHWSWSLPVATTPSTPNYDSFKCHTHTHKWTLCTPVHRWLQSWSPGRAWRYRGPGSPSSSGCWRASALVFPHHPDCYSIAPAQQELRSAVTRKHGQTRVKNDSTHKHTCFLRGDLFVQEPKLILPHCRVGEADAEAVWCDASPQDCSRMVLYPLVKSCNTDVPGMTLENNISSELLQFIVLIQIFLSFLFFFILLLSFKYIKEILQKQVWVGQNLVFKWFVVTNWRGDFMLANK